MSPESATPTAPPADVLILGSGLAGLVTALLLAKSGLSVQIIEKKTHPRFAIGEAGIRETSLTLRLLARRFNAPELLALANTENALQHIGPHVGQKESFSFLWQRPGEQAKQRHVLQLGSPSFPFGKDVHYFRSVCDHHLLRRAEAAGVAIRQGVEAVDFQEQRDGIQVQLATGETLRARFLLDGRGHVGAGKTRQNSTFQTHSRCIFTHMKHVVPVEERLWPRRRSPLPQRLDGGTVHHVFPGGWMWIIPFGNTPGSQNNLTSVGICLDPRRHPRPGCSAEAEFNQWVSRFPTVAAHLAGAEAVRHFVATERLQYRAEQGLGRRWARLPHALGFVDPLFSRGIYNSLVGVGALVEALPLCLARGDTHPLRSYIQALDRRLEVHDALVATSYQAFEAAPLWLAWERIWALGSLLESARITQRVLDPKAGTSPDGWLDLLAPDGFPTDIPAFQALFDGGRAWVARAASGEIDAHLAAEEIFKRLRTTDAAPSWLGLGDPHQRHLPIHAPGAPFRLWMWGRSAQRPPEIRRLFDFPLWAPFQARWRRNVEHTNITSGLILQ